MEKYFYGSPAYYSNKINEKSRKEKQALADYRKKSAICLIKGLMQCGTDMQDPIIQFEMETNNITLDDLGITEANDYQETKKFDYGR